MYGSGPTSDYHSKNYLHDFAFAKDMQKLIEEANVNEYIKKTKREK